MKRTMPVLVEREMYTHQLKDIDRDIARCGVLHKQVVRLLENLKEKKDFAFRA